MSVPVRHHRYSFQDYLAVEEISTVRHEFLDGEIYAMAGGSVLHAALSAAVLAALHRQLGRPLPCLQLGPPRPGARDRTRQLPGRDGRVRREETAGNPDTVVNPTLVVEVLSPSTMDYDLGRSLKTTAISHCGRGR